uniref:Uncharacterized protein n=1 Tax=Anopheles atroparvus TaxID=41427 RepID=A0AAG5DRQ9_ANOAO
MLKYLTHKLRTQSINDENHANEKIDGHDSGTESDGDLEQEDDLIQEHEMELSLSSRQDTASPTDTACSSESPAFLGASSSHLLLYDQNSSEEELEVINGGAGVVGSCDIDVGSVCGVPSRIGGDGNGGGCGVIIGGIGVAVINPHAAGVDEDDDEDDRTEEIVEEDDDEGEQEEDEEEDEEEEEEENYRGPLVTATTPTVMATATTIIGSAIGAMDTSSSNSSGVRGQFVPLGGAASDGVEGLFGRSESVDDFSDELSGLTATVSGLPAAKVTSASGKRFASVSSLLEKRKRSLAQNSDDEVRYLLEQQQQQQTPLQAHHQHSHQHQHHHHHRSLRQHHPEQHPEEDALLSAPVNFRTSPPLEALKPHRGHIIQRSTTPLVLSEGSGTGVAPGAGLLLSAGSGNSGFYGTGGSNGVGGGAGSLRFGLGRRPIGCDSPLTAAVSHRNGTNQQPQPVGGCSGAGPGLSTTTSARTSSSSTSSLSSSSSLVRLGGGTCSPSLDPCGVLEHHGSLVTNMDVSRSVSPPAKMFHCAVSPRRRQSRHQQHQRLQRPHRPCLDFDKMQQLKARSVTTWRHSNEHSGELSVFCW